MVCGVCCVKNVVCVDMCWVVVCGALRVMWCVVSRGVVCGVLEMGCVFYVMCGMLCDVCGIAYVMCVCVLWCAGCEVYGVSRCGLVVCDMLCVCGV